MSIIDRTGQFLGRGFRWTVVHTQRLFEARDPAVAKYLRQGRVYRAARALEHAWEHSVLLGGLADLMRRDSPWNPLRPLPAIGGSPELHGVEIEEREITTALGERVGHTLVLGTTRVGKTRLAEILITQDIRRGDVVVVFDPKGDEGLARRMYAEAKRAGRSDEFVMFDLGHPEHSARYNPVGSFTRITEVATRIASQLSSEGNSAAFREFAWRFTNSITRALVDLGRRPDLKNLQRYVTNIEALFIEYVEHWLDAHGPEGWRALVQKIEGTVGKNRELLMTYKGRGHHAIALAEFLLSLNNYDPVVDSMRGAFTYDRTYFDKLTASLLPLLEKLTSGKIIELLAPDYADANDPRPILDWQGVIRRKAVVYVALRSLSDREVAAAVGNAMFADLTSVAGQIYTHGLNDGLPVIGDARPPVFSLHADEFNELVGDEFIPMVNKAGGAGFQVTVYTQTISDIEAKFGSKAKAGQVVGNLNTLIMLRVKNTETAEILTQQLPKVRITELIPSSGTTDNPSSNESFSSRNEDQPAKIETDLVAPADLVQLPKGQAFALLDGGQLWKLRMPMLDPEGDPCMPPDIDTIFHEMLSRVSCNV